MFYKLILPFPIPKLPPQKKAKLEGEEGENEGNETNESQQEDTEMKDNNTEEQEESEEEEQRETEEEAREREEKEKEEHAKKVEKFVAFLRSKNLSPFATWKKELPRLCTHPSFSILPTVAERQEVFEQYIRGFFFSFNNYLFLFSLCFFISLHLCFFDN